MKISLRKILPLFLLSAISLLACTCARAYAQASALTHEVTAAEYCDFLNQNAVWDPDHLFEPKMDADQEVACIVRLGTPGNYCYQVIAGRKNFPVCYVSEFDEEKYGDATVDENADQSLKSNVTSFAVDESQNNQQLSLVTTTPSQQEGRFYTGLESGGALGTLVLVAAMVVMHEPGSDPMPAEEKPVALERLIASASESDLTRNQRTAMNISASSSQSSSSASSSSVPDEAKASSSIPKKGWIESKNLEESRYFDGTKITDAQEELDSLMPVAVAEAKKPSTARSLTISASEGDLLRTQRIPMNRISASSEGSRSSSSAASSSIDALKKRKITDLPESETKRPRTGSLELENPEEPRYFDGTKITHAPEQRNSAIPDAVTLAESKHEASHIADPLHQPTISQVEPSHHTPEEYKVADEIGDTWMDVTSSSLLSQVAHAFANTYNRSEGIAKKIEVYEQALAALPETASPDQRSRLQDGLALMRKASAYQSNQSRVLLSEPLEKQARRANLLYKTEKFASRPNPFEKIAEQLEKDYDRLADYKSKLLELGQRIAAEPNGDNPALPSLRNHVEDMNSAITAQRGLIEARREHAQLLSNNPWIPITRKEKLAIEKNKWSCVRWDAQAQKHELNKQSYAERVSEDDLFNVITSLMYIDIEARKGIPNQQLIAWYTKSVDIYRQRITAKNAGQVEKAGYLNDSARALYRAAQEARKRTRNQEIIRLYTQSAELFQQAAAEKDAGQVKKAGFLNGAGISLSRAAEEAQKGTPNQHFITLYTQSADLYQQAAAAVDAGQVQKAKCLSDAVTAIFSEVEETQRRPPNQQAIRCYAQSAILSEQAVLYLDARQVQKAKCLSDAAFSLHKAAQEAQKPIPNQQVITLLTQSAELFQKALVTLDIRKVGANNLNNAGISLSRAAQEAQKPIPNQQVITLLTQSAELSQQAAAATDAGQVEKAGYLNNSAGALYRAAQEAYKRTPNQESINSMIADSQRIYQQAMAL